MLVLALALALDAPTSTPVASASPSPEPAVVRARFAPAHVDPMPSVGPGDAVIRNSGSTNSAGYTIVVHADATAVLAQNGVTGAKPIGKPMADALFEKLHAVGPLDAFATGHCMRSASFGSVTTVTYAGKTSGDLGCGSDPSVMELHAAVTRIANQVGATAFNVRYRHTL